MTNPAAEQTGTSAQMLEPCPVLRRRSYVQRHARMANRGANPLYE